MYFSNACVLQITKPQRWMTVAVAEAMVKDLEPFAFQPCGSQDVRKMGWVPPLQGFGGEDLVLAGDERVMLTLKTEEKILPAANIRKELKKRVDAIESEQGRKVGKKEKDALKDDVISELLPRCLTKDSILRGYISFKHRLLVIDSSSWAKAEEFCALLRKSLGSLPVVPLQSNQLPEETMTTWLKANEHPGELKVGHSARLSHDLEAGVEANLKNIDLFGDEAKSHLDAGLQVKELHMTAPDTLDFTLASSLQIKKLKWSEELKDQHGDEEDYKARADADFALMAGELDEVLLQIFSVMKVERIFDGREEEQNEPA